MACDFYQGYLCSAALPSDDMTLLLSESTLRPPVPPAQTSI